MTPDAMQPVPGWIAGAVVFSTLAVLFVLEHRRALRREVEPKLRRTARNLVVAALSAAAVQFIERPLVAPVAREVVLRQWGLLQQWTVPTWLAVVVVVLLMDYTLYVWHILVHRVPFLWRFHKVHHADLDMDASTALRFHFAEIAASIPYRALQIVVIGVSPRDLSIWQTFLMMSILFHHSNVELPVRLERRLSRVFVTPRMHGIHHSIVQVEMNSNWSSGLAVWDWMHGTVRLNVPQQAITIGVAAHQDPAEVTLPKILEMPFVNQPPSWVLPDGRTPERDAGETPRTRLVP
jgi:sterol desaturase/sphingolipid hydroxylase (fatty acid hydroxylase superfamily)